MPWDDRAWHELAEWLMRTPAGMEQDEAREEAEYALDRATALNELHSAHWALKGRLYMATGRLALAAAAYHRAARLHPSLPLGWYRFAVAAEAAAADPETPLSGMAEEICVAYERAAELIPRQHHRRNRVIGPPFAMVRAWSDVRGELLHDVLLGMWSARWREGEPQRTWEELSTLEKLDFALEGTEFGLADLLDRGGESLLLLWQQAGARARLNLLLQAAQDLADRAAEVEPPAGGTEAELVAAVTRGLPGGTALVGLWRSLEPRQKELRLWRVAAERLWQWALAAKGEQCARALIGEEQETKAGRNSGASGGDRTLNPGFTKAVLYR